ncbi:methyltransferase domain-containing protein [Pseudorhodoferax sp. Leaf267]|uniref:methyltransferase domain-containing protein n=1 Tax=Pseudorhodoferax sp. Leaf267 TaxID=1736316 RepID=UPI00138F4240|nr:methyltransferase domain-containing protein [Pseudorhodoferax sp. Leaf267]
MKQNYDNAYAYDNVYGHVVELLRRHRPFKAEDGVHVDLGCGYGRMGEAVQGELGRHYIGFDIDAQAVSSLASRGLEAHVLDFNAPVASIRQIIDGHLAGRKVLSISMVDVLEHVHPPALALEVVRRLVADHGALAVLSVPNLAHRDVGFKLAFGRYDITHAGLLDHTHVNPFTAEVLDDMLVQNGLHTIDRFDVRMGDSDQHFPGFHPALASKSVLATYLRGLRDQIDGHATTNQLVVACLAGPEQGARFRAAEDERRHVKRPFLSIVTRTQGRRRSTLNDLFLALSAQSCMDYEVVLVGHMLEVQKQIVVEEVIEQLQPHMQARVNFIRVDHGNRTTPLNAGFSAARGEYVTILDDDDLPMAHWVEVFQELALRAPGRALRSVAVRQEFDEVGNEKSHLVPRSLSGFKYDYPDRFDLLAHLRDNFTPGLAIALPRSAFQDMGIRFDESLTTAEDWDFIMRCALLCGVESSPQVTCIYRWWLSADSSRALHRPEEWRANHQRIWDKMDKAPLLLPPGSARLLRDLMEERDSLNAAVAGLRIQLQDLHAQRADTVPLPPGFEPTEAHRMLMLAIGSWSWRLSAPLRAVTAALARRPLPTFNISHMTETQAREILNAVHRSSSWRLTQPLRTVKRWFQ